VRTMGCLRVHKLNEYLIDSLKDCLKDDDPYVRKTAVICVAKVYQTSPELCEERGLLKLFEDIQAKERNSFVIANIVQVYQEINQFK
jgi:vesicle coat complex subunit